jgi:hypothetical protein
MVLPVDFLARYGFVYLVAHQQLKDSGFQLVNRSDNVQSSSITDNTLTGIFQTQNSNRSHELTPVSQRQQHSVEATWIPPLFSDPDMLNVPSRTSSGISSEHCHL